jgi:hypothetical protein
LLKSSAAEIAKLIASEGGQEFKADWHGATDSFNSEGKAEVVWCNDGGGFEQGVQVESGRNIMYYLGPFEIEVMPTAERILIFHCTKAFLVKVGAR